ncbi:MAG: carbon-nitrogen hydrolase family protein [Tindallia sp. MSAO_Bac2]|nr:MAG: carbon-nitrogen hydrolase family protein [Tindallia sp. MSAO_Bac2]
MNQSHQSVKVAVVQASPVIMDKSATVDKTVRLIKSAASQGAKIIVFPEAFIPAYPRGFSFGCVVGSRSMEGRYDWQRFYENSVTIPDEATDSIGNAAKETQSFVSIGINERDSLNGSLYCTNLYFGPDGSIMGKHRKLKPTGSERLIWGEGDGSTLATVQTPYGVMGGLICWENYMPLARAAMYEKGVKIYVAPTADARESWQYTMRHVALESRSFVLSCNQYVEKNMVPEDLPGYSELKNQPEVMSVGGSAIIDPFGNYVAGPIYNREEILTAELDLTAITRSRLDFDPCGHYSRPDVFNLTVSS